MPSFNKSAFYSELYLKEERENLRTLRSYRPRSLVKEDRREIHKRWAEQYWALVEEVG